MADRAAAGMACEGALRWQQPYHWHRLLLALLVGGAPYVSAAASSAMAGAGKSGDDMVSLNLDLPPDIQRMFEEMCELEGISQSEMLTRWIDARWEAMGYTDADLEAYEAAQAAGSGTCAAGEGRCTGDGGDGAAKASGSATSRGRAEEATVADRGSASQRRMAGGSPGLGVTGSGVPGAQTATGQPTAAATGKDKASASAADAKPASQGKKKGRPAGGGGKAAGGPGRPAGGNSKPSQEDRMAANSVGESSVGNSAGKPVGGPGRSAERAAPASASKGAAVQEEDEQRATGRTAKPRRASEGAVGANRGFGRPVVDEDDDESDEEEEEEGAMDLDAWMSRHGDEAEEEEEEGEEEE